MSATGSTDPQAPLRRFAPTRPFFVGIDSDGCVFDTMEVKHKECFIPNIVRVYRLAAIAKYVREAAEYLNLYSKWRGLNRFPGLVQTMDLVAARDEVVRRGVAIPRLTGLSDWTSRTRSLSNAALRAEVDATGDPDLVTALAWSEAVNASIAEMVHAVPPFPLVRETLDSLQGRADVMVVSATPGEALQREWDEHGLSPLAALIAGQEMGTKSEQLAAATAGRYEAGRVLMVGDAPGDHQAAMAVGALFYPIEPGREDESWRRLLEEALPRFFAGTYAGEYMNERVASFSARLPENPPWK
jgi:phosphoglycolate phosphatase-like HAD superfamily hydrolase